METTNTPKKNSKYSELLTNTGMLAIGNFSSKILVFLLIPLYTNILTKSEYGYYDLVLTTLQLLIPLFTLNVTDGVLRFVLENKNQTAEVVKISIWYLLISILPAILSLLVVIITGISPQTLDYAVYIFLYYVGNMYNQFLIQLAKGVDKVKHMVIAGVLGTITNVALCLLLLLQFHLGLAGFFIANIMGQIIPCLYLTFSLEIWRYIGAHTQRNKELEKRLLKYSIPLILTSVGWWINNTFDRYIITYIKGVDVNGLLAVAYKIPSILSIIYSLFTQAWQISAMKEYGQDGSKEFYNLVFKYLNIFMFFIAAGLIILTKPIAHLMYGNFYDAWVFVPFLVLSGVFTASAGYIAPILTSAYDTKSVALSTIYGGIINIVLNIVLLYIIGSIGVTIATAISSFVILYVRYHALENVIEKKVFLHAVGIWGALLLQSVAEIYNIYLVEAFIILVVTVLNYKSVKLICEKLYSAVSVRFHK